MIVVPFSDQVNQHAHELPSTKYKIKGDESGVAINKIQATCR